MNELFKIYEVTYETLVQHQGALAKAIEDADANHTTELWIHWDAFHTLFNDFSKQRLAFWKYLLDNGYLKSTSVE